MIFRLIKKLRDYIASRPTKISYTDAIVHIFGPVIGTIIVARLTYVHFYRKSLSFSEFQKFLLEGKVSKVVCGSDSLSFILRSSGQIYHTLVPSILRKDDLWALLNSKRGSIELAASSFERIGKQIVNNLLTATPIVYLAFVVYFMNKMLNGKKETSNAELLDASDTGQLVVTFDDVAGLGPAKEVDIY